MIVETLPVGLILPTLGIGEDQCHGLGIRLLAWASSAAWNASCPIPIEKSSSSSPWGRRSSSITAASSTAPANRVA